MQLALGDALAVTLLSERGFSAKDFKDFHPGGKLGANLKYVRDIMHVGEAMPLLPTGALMSEGILKMSAKGFGTLGVVDANGNLIGIVTDGDLRRNMSPALLEQPIEKIMTVQSFTASPNQLVSEILERLSSRRINALFVVENGQPIGILHFHDVLRAGVA
jgi:arabinose-5-phosphate isomerase